MRAKTSIGLLIALSVVVAGCSSPEVPASPDGAGGSSDLAFCDAAENEPAVMWYSSNAPERNQAVVAAFAEKFPSVEISELRLASGALTTRYEQERSAGADTADLVTVADPSFVQDGLDSAWFETFEQAELPALDTLDPKYFNNGSTLTGISLYGIAYNTNAVTEPITSWEDLTDPIYRDRLLMVDVRNFKTQMTLLQTLRENYKDRFLRNIVAQNVTLVDSSVPGSQQVAAGQYDIVFPSTLSSVAPLIEKGAPIEFVVPELTEGNEAFTVISTETDSSNAAKCFYNFMFTEDGQIAVNGSVSVSPLGAVGETPEIPAQYQSPDVESLTPEIAAEIESLLKF